MEKRRAGLDATLRLWIILDEYNQDTIGRSFYPEPEPPLGRRCRCQPATLIDERSLGHIRPARLACLAPTIDAACARATGDEFLHQRSQTNPSGAGFCNARSFATKSRSCSALEIAMVL